MPTKAFIALLIFAGLAAALLSARERTDPSAALQAEAAALTKDYGQSLLGTLKGALDSSGPLGAIEFCNKQAPAIAEQASSRSGWRMSRTSLKPRNPAAAPDRYETEVMRDFVTRIAAGEPVTSLKRAEIVEHDGTRQFRYVQAIPTGELCLGCHGSNLAPAVAAKIGELYPTDQATGFRQGDMRGVFTLSKKL